jgi:hypothetical protein
MGSSKTRFGGFLFGLNIVMPTFITPYSGQAELTAQNGLTIIDQGLYRYSQSGYNDRATFGLSLTYPSPQEGGELHLRATNWPIAVIGNALTEYYDPTTGNTYPASQCRITVRGQWQVIRQPNSNSFNSVGVNYNGITITDLGERVMNPQLLTFNSPFATYIIQGANVDGGAQNTFSSHDFFCKTREVSASDNSNREYQSNSVTRPAFVYTYSKSWQIG